MKKENVTYQYHTRQPIGDCTDEAVCVHNASLQDAVRTCAILQGLDVLSNGPELFEQRPSLTLRALHYFLVTHHHVLRETESAQLTQPPH